MYNKLLKEFHPTLNGQLKLSDFNYGTHKKVWWKCDVAEDHVWEAPICDRTINESGCLCCNGKKVVVSNSLATMYPKIAKEWHSTKNNTLTPFNVTVGSHKKVWWKCDISDDHEWESNTHNRVNGNGCPCCIGQKVVLSNCLETTHPDVAKQWHPTKNIKLTPFDITAKSNKKVWWKCDKNDDHEWESTISNKTRIDCQLGCPFCSGHKVALSTCLATVNPNRAKLWHPTKNNELTPFDVTANSNIKVWWKCDVADDHEWESTINYKPNSLNTGCPCCYGFKAVLSNCLYTTHPNVANQWHPTKNIPSTPFDITFGSSKKTWWKCNHNHEWIATVNSVVNSVNSGGTGCPICYDSNGEKKIKNILDQMNIHYENQKTFDDCKDTKKLRFDFYLLKYNLLIEYDGIQHFKQSDFFGGTKGFESYKKRDRIKNEYADKNNIPLLRIPYTKFDLIEDEINYFLRKHTNHDT